MTTTFLELTKTSLLAELQELHREVRHVVDELTDQQLWAKPIEPGNSIGHLILHLTGNLNHFVGAQLGGTSYVRDREREFTEPNPPSRADLLSRFDDVLTTCRRVVGGLDEQQMLSPHPTGRFGSVFQTLLHLVAHFALHRGQMSYLARLVKGKN